MSAASSPDYRLPAPGSLFADRYRIVRLLGVGGMGSVLLARHEVIGQYVALKLLHPHAARSRDAVERFVREARAAAKIDGQHVVRVHDVGAFQGRPYLCMEYLRGKDLAQVQDEHGQLPSHDVCSVLLDASVALAQAHAAGIVHRDLKPSNLFFAEQPAGKPVLKVLDFGIAKMEEGRERIHATSPGTIMGTPAYMAPEQMRSSKAVDARADIWALGVIAYELMTGRLPYEGESLGDILFAVVETPPPPPHELCPQIPADLSAVILKCLEREPERRYASVSELAEALEPFATVSRVGTAASIRASLDAGLLSVDEREVESADTLELVTSVRDDGTRTGWVTDRAVRPLREADRFVIGAALGVAIIALLVAGSRVSRATTTRGAAVEANPPDVVPATSASPPAAPVKAVTTETTAVTSTTKIGRDAGAVSSVDAGAPPRTIVLRATAPVRK